MFPHGVPSGSNGPLSGFVEGSLNGVFIDPAKIGPELLKVNGLRGDSLFVLSKVGDEGMLNSPLKNCQIHLSWGHGHRVGKSLEPRWGHQRW